MRISNRIMADHIKANLSKQSSQLMKTQLKLASGKEINKPSDDPVGMGKVLDYRTTLSTIDQYRDNILDAKTRVEFTEAILDQAQDMIRQAKNIASNPDTESKVALAQEIDNIREQVLGLANSKYGTNYIFSGHVTDTAPFDTAAPYAYNGDNGSHQVIVGEGITIPIETDGEQIFIEGADNLFAVLDSLESTLLADPFDRTAVQAHVDPLTRIDDQIQLVRSNLSFDYLRLERTETFWYNMSNSVETMRADVEDVDITKTAIDMQVQQTAYEVLLATSASVIQPTLVDFLG
ncbi:flagellar hook-associated protein FlgL [Desulfosarcina alkanivorans]|uniref:Flagellar hook-associated protein FlgL n=1 Tax=Desulfosarcina alkanivorans TaxID=571177 RepID=A0A5K7YCB8_9BACT|nr:flagellar hook-associated protein FlgL [Desulfosarcina alkanivorans]BBO66788.1 flagellar hook-associated protein FlgL [Desulfosarcina alkanivorans]